MKKILVLFLSMVLMLALSVCAFADEMKVSLTGLPETVRSGEPFEITVSLANAADAKTAGLKVTLPAGIKLVSGGWQCSGALIKNFDADKMLGAVAFQDAVDMNGDVFKLVLKAEQNVADAELAVSLELRNGDVTVGYGEAAVSISTVIPPKPSDKKSDPEQQGNEEPPFGDNGETKGETGKDTHNEPDPSSDESSREENKAGVLIAVIAAVLVIAGGCVLFSVKRKSAKRLAPASDESENPAEKQDQSEK